MLEIKKLELIPREIQAVQFTGDNYQAVQQWVQDRLAFQQVTATADRLYLPGTEGVEVLEPGDWVFYDPKDNFFRGASDDAVMMFYRVLPEEPETPQE